MAFAPFATWPPEIRRGVIDAFADYQRVILHVARRDTLELSWELWRIDDSLKAALAVSRQFREEVLQAVFQRTNFYFTFGLLSYADSSWAKDYSRSPPGMQRRIRCILFSENGLATLNIKDDYATRLKALLPSLKYITIAGKEVHKLRDYDGKIVLNLLESAILYKIRLFFNFNEGDRTLIEPGQYWYSHVELAVSADKKSAWVEQPTPHQFFYYFGLRGDDFNDNWRSDALKRVIVEYRKAIAIAEHLGLDASSIQRDVVMFRKERTKYQISQIK